LVAQIKFIVRRLKLTDCQELAVKALQSESPAEILALCAELAHRSAPGLFDVQA